MEESGMNTLNELADEVHKIAVDHGFWEEDRPFGDTIALIHSEATEAYEEWRKGKEVNATYYSTGTNGLRKPEGIPTELADIIIRVLDLCGRHNMDIDGIVREKIEYNRTRPYRHGGRLT